MQESKEKRKKRYKIINRKRFVVFVVIFICVIGSASILVHKFAPKKSKNNALINNKLSQSNAATELPKDNKMDSREQIVSPENKGIDTALVDVYKSDGHKVAFLTFDDGPYVDTTPQILKILDSFNIKATFFIVGQMAEKYPSIVKLEANDGESIGNHTYSHNYNTIYSNEKAFIDDVKKCDSVLKSIIGNNYNGNLIRFPGGSFGIKRKPYREAVKNAGYKYLDWNDLTGDAEAQNVPVTKLVDNLKRNTSGKEHVVILMHDGPGKKTTVEALPQVIQYLKSEGYSFNTIR